MALKPVLYVGCATMAVMFSCEPGWAQAANGSDANAKTPAVQTAKRPPAKKRRDKKTDKDNGPQVANENGRLEGDIVVTGLRENTASARSAKRRASQIVDVVLAQDIGKLPDKNVPEALARVPGVQLERDRGEGGSIRIRGLSGVMTTVNGSPTFSAGDRTTYLNDISSELVAGIEVFKTRTPDQVEGSQTGVVNLTLRRPFDFKRGATYVLNVRGDYSDQARKLNPSGSALVTYNADTEIGRMGFMVNGTFNRLAYNESVRWNGFPSRVSDSRQIVQPSTTPANIFMPANVGFAGPNGWSRRAAVQMSGQWQASDRLRFVLEAGFSNTRLLWADNQFNIDILGAGQRLSNIVLNDDGRSAKSVSVDGTALVGPGRQSWEHETRNYNARAQVDFSTEQAEITGQINYNKSNNQSNNIFHWNRFNQQPQFDVTFNTTSDPKGGSDITFKNIDLLDPNNYRYIDGFSQSNQYSVSSEIESKVDVKLNTFVDLIDYVKIGFRNAIRDYDRNYGDRSLSNLRIPISALPNYQLTDVGRAFAGSKSAANANWLIGDTNSIRSNWNAIRALISPTFPEMLTYYPKYNPYNYFGGKEGSYAAYGMFHYNIKLLFPVDGVIGARLVNSTTSLKSVQIAYRRVVNNGVTSISETSTIINPKGNYLDIMPSINAIVHFTPKLQMRAAYTSEVGRPSAYDMNPRLQLNLLNPVVPTAAGGNGELHAISTTKYDASLEWYFGQTGSISLAAWEWKQDGFIAYQTLPEVLPDAGDTPVLVTRPYNLGRGKHRGLEGSATTFFQFLPGFFKSFGASVNGTLNLTRQAYPVQNAQGERTYTFGPYLYVSKYVYNLIGFFERGGLNVRVAYNWRSRQQVQVSGINPYSNQFFDPVERLDASINYDLTRNIQLSVQADNITRNGNQLYWGSHDYPRDIRYFARNLSMSIRLRL